MKPLDFEHYEHITQNVCLDAGYVGSDALLKIILCFLLWSF